MSKVNIPTKQKAWNKTRRLLESLTAEEKLPNKSRNITKSTIQLCWSSSSLWVRLEVQHLGQMKGNHICLQNSSPHLFIMDVQSSI